MSVLNVLTKAGHYVIGLALFGLVGALAAIGTITGGEALSVATGVGAVLIGGAIATNASTTGKGN